MSRTRSKSDELTKQAVLAELEKLRQGRHARYQTLVGRFARCQEAQHAATLFSAAVEATARAYSRTPVGAHAARSHQSLDGPGRRILAAATRRSANDTAHDR